MKRIAICISIGIISTLIAYGFIQYWKSKSSYYYATLPKYKGQIKIRIGDAADNKGSISATLDQIKKRFDVKADQLDKNIFLLSFTNLLDTTSVRKLVSESIELRFLETYSIAELQVPLTELDKELSQRKKQATDTSDKYAFLSEPDNNESKKKHGTISLGELINFIPPFQGTIGRVRYAAELGKVKSSDTAYLNKILSEEQVRNIFPENLFFAYGHYDGNPKEKGFYVNIYAIKIPDPKYYLYPTGDNVEDCKLDFDPLTGNPVLLMKFDAEGSEYWYHMTERNNGKSIAILANDFVLTAPAPESAIKGGESRINGNFTIEEAWNLQAMIRSGKLLLPVSILEIKFKATKRIVSEFWMLAIVFLLATLVAYGISFLIKPASKP